MRMMEMVEFFLWHPFHHGIRRRKIVIEPVGNDVSSPLRVGTLVGLSHDDEDNGDDESQQIFLAIMAKCNILITRATPQAQANG